MSDLLNIDNISTGYHWGSKKELVLHQALSAQLSAGEMVCVLGVNGSGKSTFLRTLLGFENLNKGEVYYGGDSLKKLSVSELSKKVAVVLTDKIDDSFLTSYEIVSSGRYPYASYTGKLKPKDHDIIVRSIALVGAEKLSNHYFRNLSDGEKQRVMIARAIAQDTELIFLDEPAAFIDSPGKFSLMELLKTLSHDFHKGILLTTHDLEPALRFADTLWLFSRDGRFASGKPDFLVESNAINTFFDTQELSFNKKSQRFERR